MKGILRNWLSEDPPVEEDENALAAEVARLRKEAETYKHAFETTVADRDRLKKNSDNYKYAFETTANDRELWKARALQWQCAVNEIVARSGIHWMLSGKPPTTPLQLPTDVPNVYCVGVQKTATSFLYSIVRQHPGVQVTPKDQGSLRRLHQSGDLDKYRQEVGTPEAGKPVFAHFDVSAIDVRGISSTIRHKLCSGARIIICLRDPVSRALSEWKMRVRRIRPNGNFVESLEFIEAIDAQEQRAKDDPTEFAIHFDYIGRSLYADRIEEFIATFGRGNVHVVLMENDLENNFVATISGIFRFLSLLDADALRLALGSYDQFYEASRSPRRIFLRVRTSDGTILDDPCEAPQDVDYLWIDSDSPVQLKAEVANPLPSLVKDAVRLHRRQAYQPSDEERKELFDQYFRHDVDRLQELLGRDLSVWAR